MKISFDSDKDCSTLLQECRIKLHDNYSLFTSLPMVCLIGSPTFIKKKKKKTAVMLRTEMLGLAHKETVFELKILKWRSIKYLTFLLSTVGIVLGSTRKGALLQGKASVLHSLQRFVIQVLPP